MVKKIFKFLWILISIITFLFTLYFLFGNGGSGIVILKDLFSNGFWNGIKEFFVSIWNGFKTVVGLG